MAKLRQNPIFYTTNQNEKMHSQYHLTQVVLSYPLFEEKMNHFIVGTGFTDHIVNQGEAFENLHQCNGKNVQDPKGNLSAVEGIGYVLIIKN